MTAPPLKVSTITRRLAAISEAHKVSCETNPTQDQLVRETMAGIRRMLRVAPNRKEALSTEQIRAAVNHLGRRLVDDRDRVVLLLGYAGGFRRSELVSIDVEDLDNHSAGLVVQLRVSKTDQEGQGRRVEVVYGQDPATCPVLAVAKATAWAAADRHDEAELGGRRPDRPDLYRRRPSDPFPWQHGTVRRLPLSVVLVLVCVTWIGLLPSLVANRCHPARRWVPEDGKEDDEPDVVRGLRQVGGIRVRHTPLLVYRFRYGGRALFWQKARAGVLTKCLLQSPPLRGLISISAHAHRQIIADVPLMYL
jgi:integrase